MFIFNLDRHFRILLVSTLVIFASSATAADDEPRFTTEELKTAQLASFDDGLFEGISKYSGDPDAAAILANCRVLSRVSVDNNFARCYLADTNHRKRFITDVERVADRAKLNSAVVADKAEWSEIYFRVLLTRDAEGSAVHFYENWGHDAEKYGYAYRSPQRLTLRERTGDRLSCGGSAFITKVTIGTDGRPHDDVEFETVKGKPSEECFDYFRKQLLRGYFIPGRLNDEAIEARFIQMVEF